MSAVQLLVIAAVGGAAYIAYQSMIEPSVHDTMFPSYAESRNPYARPRAKTERELERGPHFERIPTYSFVPIAALTSANLTVTWPPEGAE